MTGEQKREIIERIARQICKTRGTPFHGFEVEETTDVLAVIGAIEALGGKVVFGEPTRKMWAASGDAQLKRYGGFNFHHDVVSECVWTAMISASPKLSGAD